MKEFFAMGGYGFYVWTAYGFFAVVLIWSTVAPLIRRRGALQRIEDRAERDRSTTHDAHS